MKILFLHRTFPSQFHHLAAYFIREGHEVRFLATVVGEGDAPALAGMEPQLFSLDLETEGNLPPELEKLSAAVHCGKAAAKALKDLAAAGFYPDIIIGHADWGLLLYLKTVCPESFLVGYFEWYPHDWNEKLITPLAVEPDLEAKRCHFTAGATTLLSFQACNACLCPTIWQRDQFPLEYRPRLKVLHEGIDTNFETADKQSGFSLLRTGCNIPAGIPLVTYVSRGLEPLRGFSQFMAAARLLLKHRPDCHIIIAGKDASYYGSPPQDGHHTWKHIEDDIGIDYTRIHFTGRLSREEYKKLLRASWVHVYLTRPFVLSWSLLESMAAGCAVVAADTAPVREVITDGVNGLLTAPSDPEKTVMRIEELLNNAPLRQRLGEAAKNFIQKDYDSKRCAEKQAEWILGAVHKNH